ncbi:hypothetical protein M9H77_31456 [Catharanthus roseus]|uniref:Uncharacterized protein n=1 Tax=Catharanthus roseus TaxID=4058 RepID=A0ACC0A273_CATRO|nr:hypothetical protein M9H77_31456 [Catharanthus roseus]
MDWAKETTMKVNTYLIITRYLRSRIYDRRPYITLGCEYRGANKSRTKSRVDNEEEEVPIKRRDHYGTKKHNHAIGVYNHGHTQAARLTEEQLIQTEQFIKVMWYHVISYSFFKNKMRVVPAQKIYNIVTNMKKNRMQERNTKEEVLCLGAQWGYTVFYKNCGDSIVLSDIIVVHTTLIRMMRTWPYLLIMDAMYKTNK